MVVLLHTIPGWLELISLAFCLGTLVLLLWVVDASADAEVRSPENIRTRLWRSYGICLVVAILCTIADLLIGASEISGGSSRAVFAVLPTVLFKTHFGRVWLIRFAAILTLVVALQTGRGSRDSRGSLYFMLALWFIIAMTKSASGHASDSGDFSNAEIADLLHLVAASSWGGGLFALAVVILPPLVQAADCMLIARVASRFSRLAGYAVGVIALTALYNGLLYVGRFEALWLTPYGWMVVAKIFLFFLLVTVGAFNRYATVPLLQEWAGLPSKKPSIADIPACTNPRLPGNDERSRSAERFLNAVRAEALLMALVLLCAALLRHEVPARHAMHREHAGHAGHEAHMRYAPRQESASVRIEMDPATVTAGVPESITVHLTERRGKPLRELTLHHERVLHAVIIGQDLSVFAHIHPEDLGPLTEEMVDEASFPLRYTFPKAGTYIMGLDFATQDGVYSKTTTFSVSGQPPMNKAKIDFSKTKDFGPYRVALATSPAQITAGKKTTLRYSISSHGKPAKGLEPYLGAAMHLAVVSSDLSHFVHTHGIIPGEIEDQEDRENRGQPPLLETSGLEIESTIIFPAKGDYKVFSQVQIQGKVLLFDFMVKVE